MASFILARSPTSSAKWGNRGCHSKRYFLSIPTLICNPSTYCSIAHQCYWGDPTHYAHPLSTQHTGLDPCASRWTQPRSAEDRATERQPLSEGEDHSCNREMNTLKKKKSLNKEGHSWELLPAAVPFCSKGSRSEEQEPSAPGCWPGGYRSRPWPKQEVALSPRAT